MRRSRNVWVLFLTTGLFAAGLFAGGAARAAGFRSRIPPEAVAFWRFDTSRFAAGRADPALQAQRRVLIAGLRAAVASGLIAEPKAASVLEAILAASEVGARPHTLCLIDLSAGRPPSGEGMAPSVLRLTLELESTGDHATLLRTVRAILLGDGTEKSDGATQRELDLPGGVRGVAYRKKGWAPWHEVQWASTDHSFVIGLGAGSLERWFAAQSADEEETPTAWDAHRAFVDAARPAGDVFFQAYLGLDRVRTGFPYGFINGRTRRVLETLSLSNARDVMVQARWIEPPAGADHPPLIAADVTWSARSEAPGTVHGLPISLDAWPTGAVAMAPPPGTYAIVMPVKWGRWVQTALDLVWAAAKGDDAPRKRALLRGWTDRNAGTLGVFLGQLEPWLIVSDVPAPVTPMPGAATFFIELKRGVSAQRAGAALRALLGSRMDRVMIEDGVWSFKVDRGGVLRIPSWGFVGPADKPILVGGWGPPVVTENRARLGDPAGDR